jgi:hypothetical protein
MMGGIMKKKSSCKLVGRCFFCFATCTLLLDYRNTPVFAQCNVGNKPTNIQIVSLDPDTIGAGSGPKILTVEFKLTGSNNPSVDTSDPSTVSANWGDLGTLPADGVSDLGSSRYSARFGVQDVLLAQPQQIVISVNVNYCNGGTITSSTYPLQIGYFYYFAHLTAAQIWRTTLTYVNPSTSTVQCDTSFYSDSGQPLLLSFDGISASKRTDIIQPGGTLHVQTDAEPDKPVATGWARSYCDGAIKASTLFRSYDKTVTNPTAEGGVIAMTAPASRFVTFADQITGVAYANPSHGTASVNFIVKDTTGSTVQTWQRSVLAGAHGSFNVRDVGVPDFTGSLTIDSSMPIISLSLNFESAPLFSALPAGETGNSRDPASYYFAHLAARQIWRTTLTYVNPLNSSVQCDTHFYSDAGEPLLLSFEGKKMSARTDILQPGGALHVQTDAEPELPVVTGWARCDCSGSIKASVLFRSYDKTVAKPTAEGSVIAMTGRASSFVTFADQDTGVACANPSDETAMITFTARDRSGSIVGTWPSSLLGKNHEAFNVRTYVPDFTGSLSISSPVPIISLSLNFESKPLFSALPPGEDNVVP